MVKEADPRASEWTAKREVPDQVYLRAYDSVSRPRFDVPGTSLVPR